MYAWLWHYAHAWWKKHSCRVLGSTFQTRWKGRCMLCQLGKLLQLDCIFLLITSWALENMQNSLRECNTKLFSFITGEGGLHVCCQLVQFFCLLLLFFFFVAPYTFSCHCFIVFLSVVVFYSLLCIDSVSCLMKSLHCELWLWVQLFLLFSHLV